MTGRIIRINKYRSIFTDGKGWCEYRTVCKDEVFVAVLIGVEPKKIERESQFADVEGAILRMAENIKAARKIERDVKRQKEKLGK